MVSPSWGEMGEKDRLTESVMISLVHATDWHAADSMLYLWYLIYNDYFYHIYKESLIVCSVQASHVQTCTTGMCSLLGVIITCPRSRQRHHEEHVLPDYWLPFVNLHQRQKMDIDKHLGHQTSTQCDMPRDIPWFWFLVGMAVVWYHAAESGAWRRGSLSSCFGGIPALAITWQRTWPFQLTRLTNQHQPTMTTIIRHNKTIYYKLLYVYLAEIYWNYPSGQQQYPCSTERSVQDRATAGQPSNSRVVASHDGRPPFSSVSNEQAEKLFQAAFSGRGVDEMLDQELARFNIKPGQLKILPLTTCCIWSSIVCIIHLSSVIYFRHNDMQDCVVKLGKWHRTAVAEARGRFFVFFFGGSSRKQMLCNHFLHIIHSLDISFLPLKILAMRSCPFRKYRTCMLKETSISL